MIRNATVKIRYGGLVFLIDPYFADRFTQPPFSGLSKNPTVDLPLPVDEILKDVDFILVSHLHPDHFDEKAQEMIPKNFPLFCQPKDVEPIRNAGFRNITGIHSSVIGGDLIIHRTGGNHGSGEILKFTGPVSGFVFEHPEENTLYWCGDTIFCDEVKISIRKFRPQIIVCHAGGNRFLKELNPFGVSLPHDSQAVIMDEQQVVELCNFAPDSQIIATHLEALDHETVTRQGLRDYTLKRGIPEERLFIPGNGSTLNFNLPNYD